MNLDKYEKIDGWQALERFKNGEAVYSFYNNEFSEFVMAGGELYSSPLSKHVQQRNPRTMTIDAIFKRNWYIPKPFDVRQAMFDRPNEWVAAYNDERGKWIQVGFDTVSMRPIKAYYGYSGLVKGATAQQATSFELDACIPIEDVPEEANQ